jgi:hypothetical protein
MPRRLRVFESGLHPKRCIPERIVAPDSCPIVAPVTRLAVLSLNSFPSVAPAETANKAQSWCISTWGLCELWRKSRNSGADPGLDLLSPFPVPCSLFTVPCSLAPVPWPANSAAFTFNFPSPPYTIPTAAKTASLPGCRSSCPKSAVQRAKPAPQCS